MEWGEWDFLISTTHSHLGSHTPPPAHSPISALVRKGRDCRSPVPCTCDSSRGGAYQQGIGRTSMGSWRARSLTLADFCALEHDEECCAAGQHPWRSATCSCLLRDHAQEGLLIWRLAKKVPRRRGMTGSKRRGARGRGENAISHIVKKA